MKWNSLEWSIKIFHCHPYSSSEKGSIEICTAFRVHSKGKSIDKYVGQDLKPIGFYKFNPRIYKVLGLNGKQMQ